MIWVHHHTMKYSYVACNPLRNDPTVSFMFRLTKRKDAYNRIDETKTTRKTTDTINGFKDSRKYLKQQEAHDAVFLGCVQISSYSN